MLPIETTADGVVILSLTANPTKPRGGVVVLDAWLIGEIALTLDAVAAMTPTGVILRSASERVFVAGADLAEIDALDDAALHRYLQRGTDAFARLHRLSCPTVALVHRAALGGGLEVAMHCDGIIGVLPSATDKPWRIGLPESSLGICPGWGGTQMLPARIDPFEAIVRTATGRTDIVSEVPPRLFNGTAATTADALTLAHEWLRSHPRTRPLDHPPAISAANACAIDAALIRARGTLAPTASSDAVLDCVAVGAARGWADALAAERSHLVALRHTATAREKLAQFLKPAQ
ncbi:MAG: enoyl-CoA hydratase/isomerase family protein [Phycisphaerales bacterium]|nr:enoyl-CoA hydratase/isomerase family protein [Phycisphaerales bacterium]